MLPSTTKIQNAIDGLDSTSFEELVCAVYGAMYKNHNGFSISHHGKEHSKKHPAKHPIDIELSFINETNSIHHIFIAVSNQINNLYSKSGKLRSDCDSILEYVEEYNIRNVEVIAVYARKYTKATYPNYVSLKNELENKGISLSLVNAETFNHLINEYCPSAYKEFLGLNVYSGGITYLDEHIDNKLGEYYKHDLLGRESELKELQEILIKKRALLIRGHSGCGKTRLAIELAKTAFQSDYKVLWVESFNFSSINDLDTYYDKDKKIIVIIDDINKISFFNELLNKVLHQSNTYVIMTIRDYLFDSFKQTIDVIYFEYQLKELEPNKIKDILKDIFAVNDEFLDFILMVTRNNLRFSIMATKVLAIDHKTTKSIGEIYEAYYKELIDKIGIGQNEDLKRTIAALAFFDSIDLRSDDNNELICSTFGIKKDNFLEMCDIAHEKEIADFYFDRMFIKISDQIFAEYLFYKYVFVNRKLDIFNIFKTYHISRRQKFIQIINAIINVYYPDEGFKIQLENFKNKVIASKDKKLIVSFFTIFAKLFISESIEYSYKELKDCNTEVDDFFAGDLYGDLCDILLSNHDSRQYHKVAVHLLTLLKKDNMRNGLLKKIESRCHIKKDDYVYSLSFFTELIGGLCELSRENDIYLNPLFEIVKKVYPYESTYSEYSSKNSVSFCRLVMPLNEQNKKLRETMWTAINLLHDKSYDDNKLNELVKHNFASADVSQHKKFDSQYALEIAKKLDFSKPRDIVFAYSLLYRFYKFKDINEFINTIHVDDETKLYFDFVVSKRSGLYGDEYKNALINHCFSKYSTQDELSAMLSRFYQKFGQYEAWLANTIIANGFEYISSVDKCNYDNHLLYFLENNSNYSGNPYFLTILLNDKNAFTRWAENSSLKYRNSFIASILFGYKVNEINDELYNYAFDFFVNEFTRTSSGWGNENITSLMNFEHYKSGFIYGILKSIEINNTTSHFVEALFIIDKSADTIFSLLNNDLELLKKVYFALLNCVRFYDHDGKILEFLLSKEPTMIGDVLKLVVEGKTDIDKMECLYAMPNFVEAFIDIISSSPFAHINFVISHSVEKMPNDIFKSLAKTFIQRYKDDFDQMQQFSIIAEHRDTSTQIEFVDLLIENKVQKHIFEGLCLFGGPTSWSGSPIPYINNNIQAIKNYLNSKAIPSIYREELEEIIERLKKRIRFEEIEIFNRGY